MVDVPSRAEFDAALARLTKVEAAIQNPTPPANSPTGGNSPPDVTPPPPNSPPDPPPVPVKPTGPATAPGTKITTAGVQLITRKGSGFRLITDASGKSPKGSFAIEINAVPDGRTHSVKVIATDYNGDGVQQDTFGWWYRYADASDSWTGIGTTDPTVKPAPPPNSPPDVPTPPNSPPDDVTPLPPPTGTGPRLVGLYTSGPDDAWNYGVSADYDAKVDIGITGFEQMMGVTVNAYDLFPLWDGTQWDDEHIDAALSSMRNNSKKAKAYVPVIGLKFWINEYGWNDIKGLQANSAGVFDDTWKNVVNVIAGNQFQRAIIRLGYEDNFTFMVDSWANMQDAWIAAFNHVADVMQAQAKLKNVKLYMGPNPVIGQGSAPVDAVVKGVASRSNMFLLDFYNNFWSGDPSLNVNNADDRKKFWMTSASFNLTNALALAKQTGLGVYLPEFGAGPDVSGGGHGVGNDVAFVDTLRWFVGQLRGAGLPFYGGSYWDINPSDAHTRVSDGSQPQLAAALKAAYADGTLVGDPLP